MIHDKTRESESFPCPQCGNREAVVTDSRQMHTHRYRRRECANGHRFTTRETVVPSPEGASR